MNFEVLVLKTFSIKILVFNDNLSDHINPLHRWMHFSSFSLVESPPRGLQIAAYLVPCKWVLLQMNILLMRNGNHALG